MQSYCVHVPMYSLCSLHSVTEVFPCSSKYSGLIAGDIVFGCKESTFGTVQSGYCQFSQPESIREIHM